MVLTDGKHLVATDLDELHGFAKKIGLKRKWFQEHPVHPHYDLTTPKKFLQALGAGAKMCTSKSLVRTMKMDRFYSLRDERKKGGDANAV
jgi:hypothetical protein